MSYRVAIIGTAGRKDDGPRLSLAAFKRMIDAADEAITSRFMLQRGEVTLVSGGAAWGDHVAVGLFLRSKATADPYAGLHLHLPAQLGLNGFDGHPNAHTANYYHRLFGGKVGGDPIKGLHKAIAAGATADVHDGFFARNLAIAREVSHMVAFTFGGGDRPRSFSGTRHTWEAAQRAKRLHIDLFQLLEGL